MYFIDFVGASGVVRTVQTDDCDNAFIAAQFLASAPGVSSRVRLNARTLTMYGDPDVWKG